MLLEAGPSGLRQDAIIYRSPAAPKTTQRALYRLSEEKLIVHWGGSINVDGARVAHASFFRN